jgi:hypothetical protein
MQLIPRANEARICAALGLHVGVQSMWLKANSGSFRSSRDLASRAMSSASSFAPPLLRPFDPDDLARRGGRKPRAQKVGHAQRNGRRE